MSTLQTNTIKSLSAGITPVQQDSTGREMAQGAKAWVRFDGSVATPTPTDSFNVISITDNGAGNYTVNFTTAMLTANYSAIVSGYIGTNTVAYTSSHTTTGVISRFCNLGGTATDASIVSLAVFSND